LQLVVYKTVLGIGYWYWESCTPVYYCTRVDDGQMCRAASKAATRELGTIAKHSRPSCYGILPSLGFRSSRLAVGIVG
jgi:hypothetical protein